MMYKLEVTTPDRTFVSDFSTLEIALAAIKLAMQENAVVKLWKEE
jgi:hypothetical protein